MNYYLFLVYMHMNQTPKRHRFPVSIISHTVWLYHRFNNSYRDIQEQMAYRGIILSHKTVRFWCYKFASYFQDVIRKKERKPTDKWHLRTNERKNKWRKIRTLESC